MNRVSLLLVAVAVTAYLGGLAGGAGAQPGLDVDVQRCENAAHNIPEFGGAYLAEREADGIVVLHVWMTEADAAATEAALTALRKRCPEHADVVIHNADYSYAQLNEWQRLAWTVSAVTLTGIDTRANRLTVGVADLDSDGSEVRDALTQRGVPADALALMEISEAQTLPVVDHSRSVGLAAALGVAVVVAAALAMVWLRRRTTSRR